MPLDDGRTDALSLQGRRQGTLLSGGGAGRRRPDRLSRRDRHQRCIVSRQFLHRRRGELHPAASDAERGETVSP